MIEARARGDHGAHVVYSVVISWVANVVGARVNAIDVIMQLDLLSDHGERIFVYVPTLYDLLEDSFP